MLYANKRLQNTKLYKEHTALRDKYYKTSLEKEQKQQSYYKKMTLANMQTGETVNMNYSFENYYKKYTKSIEQKVYALEAIAKKRGLVPIFVTMTLPREYHPFRSIKHKNGRLYTSVNPDFAFESIEHAISAGYECLNRAYKTMYKRIKNSVSDLLYVKVVEAHKTMLPHFHVLFFVPKSENKIIVKNFDKIKTEFSLDQYDLSEIQQDESDKTKIETVKTDISRASKYIMKYITKNLSSGEDFFTARLLDGWKRVHKIRMITSSNLPLSLADYRTIYHSLDEDRKNSLLHEAKEKGINLFYLLLERLAKVITLKQGANSVVKKYKTLLSSRFIILKEVVRSSLNGGGYSYSMSNLTFFIDREIIYKKQRYIRIIN